MKKSIVLIPLAGVLLVGCKVEVEPNGQSSQEGGGSTHVTSGASYLDDFGPVVNLKGYDEKTIELENKTREITYVASAVLGQMAIASGLNESGIKVKLEDAITNSAGNYTFSGMGSVNVSTITKNGENGLSMRGTSGKLFNVNLPPAFIIESGSWTKLFSYSKSDTGFLYEFVMVGSKLKYAKYEHGDIHYSFEKKAGNWIYTSKKGSETYVVNHDENSQRVTMSKNGKQTLTGNYNISDDTVSVN
ncbi:hypothetical protein VIBNISFn27_170132 [Vibrio nigripulchritudo SFn27]|uniref:Lipoprotein n=1 Tax=Vibrio nigripulchritudo TaxID=28173 RepID=U4KE94_9VIBR|nr:hypothetical protein [Vibrio nigripulchritudo]CCN84722.1 hypothetical protein VIBNIBLFn1_870042 [Vibrio nigripulchritudo BLFn1]CCN87786.1 hypothetical protein VIBNISFn27_170132 [Vibrio nigripulchritudo SFn27]CCN95719.1 hypothetical protein VIBNIENn2_630042 [Vibrio nigripulchritudo ENn2]CCO38875.1 hypothetical protein VIBNISFn135_1090044 [Vibrio nigripulchritudo SFn135]CCO51835.1 hypothetical protein VIBNIWn13_150044 [Vibrio nigripulchritudo Wn13]